MTRGNEQAFPLFTPAHEVDYGLHKPHTEHGLTKRELFAALICAGMSGDPQRACSNQTYAEDAVAIADALIEALSKKEGASNE